LWQEDQEFKANPACLLKKCKKKKKKYIYIYIYNFFEVLVHTSSAGAWGKSTRQNFPE
jgi:hypothetical protein